MNPSVISNKNMIIRSQQISGYVNTRGLAGIITMSQEENRPEAYFGKNSGFLSTGSNNTFVGINSGYSNTGSNITAVGKNSAYNNIGSFNTLLGKDSGFNNKGDEITSLGVNSAYNNTGSSNTLLGNDSGYLNVGSSITAVGKNSAYNNNGSSNTLIGTSSGFNNKGDEITSLGLNSGYSNTGSYSTFVGTNAGYQCTGGYNTVLGNGAGYFRNGEASVLLGNNSGRNSTSYGLVSIGFESGTSDISGDSRNVFIGTRAGQNNTSGTFNTFVGGGSGRANTSGGNNTFIGRNSSLSNATGTGNIVVGTTSNTTNIANGIVIGNSSSSTSNNGIALGHSLTANAPGFFAKPIRTSVSGTDKTLIYNTSTSEISYSSTKTFVIEHPLEKDKMLVHGCLEGPESGVYYRGKGEIKDYKVEVELPLYVHFASDFTINITPIGEPRLISCSEMIIPDSKSSRPYFCVYGKGLFYWTVYGKRESIKTEPLKDEIKVRGEGPYRYIESISGFKL